MIKFQLISLLLCLMMFTAPAHAVDSQTRKKTEELKQLENKVAAEKARQDALKTEASKIEDDMQGLKNKLIGTTEKVQKHENTLRDIEERLSTVTAQKNKHLQDLLKDKKSLADLILALERIRRLPPETLIAKPNAPLETAQAAIVLGSLLPEVNRRAEKLKGTLAEIQLLEDTLINSREKLKDTSGKLKSEQSKMNNLIISRSKSLKSTKDALSEQETKIASLSREAKNFRDLIDAIQKRQAENNTRIMNAPHQKNELDINLPALGTGRPPVSGVVKTRYGQTDDMGATAQGITFQSRPGAVVVAPLGGIVRYAGDFRNYGQIILLEHKNKFHSLVAGLGKIDTFVGQHVDAGEPVGYLPSNSGRLYYELRNKGDPVNPSQKFSNLN
ncbi:MAG: peptidoglycan DD-metalloendopeptidase family protein [Pseudomonadota bacterium]